MKSLAQGFHSSGSPAFFASSSVMPLAISSRTMPEVVAEHGVELLQVVDASPSGPWPGMIFASAGILAIMSPTFLM